MKKIAVFASGSGTNFEAIASACEDGRIPAQCVLMVCDKPGAPVIERAARHGVPAFVFSPRQYESKAAFEKEIVERLDAAGVELVCLAGYMRIVGDPRTLPSHKRSKARPQTSLHTRLFYLH